jgi:hypothetical protein
MKDWKCEMDWSVCTRWALNEFCDEGESGESCMSRARVGCPKRTDLDLGQKLNLLPDEALEVGELAERLV